MSAVRLLSPVANPSKIIGAPVNYKKHLDEVATDPSLHHQNVAHTRPIQQAGLFLKATSSLVGASQGVVIRHPDRRTDHEVELAVIIGERADRVSAKRRASPRGRLLHWLGHHRARSRGPQHAEIDRYLQRAGALAGHRR